MKMSTKYNVIRSLQCYTFFPQMRKELLIVAALNVKTVYGKGLYYPENRTSYIPIWTHIMLSFTKMNETILTCHKPFQKFSNFASRLLNNRLTKTKTLVLTKTK